MARRVRDMTPGEIGNSLGVAAKTVVKWIDAGHFRGSYSLPGSNDRRVSPQSVLEFAGKNKIPCTLPGRFNGLAGGCLVVSADTAVNAVSPITPCTLAEASWQMREQIPSLIVLDRILLSVAEVIDLIRLACDRIPFARIVVLGLEDEPESEWERYTPATVLARPFGAGTLLGTLTEKGA